MSRTSLNSMEARAVSGLAGLYGLRMLGLFMVLPVLPLLLEDFNQATPLAIGLAVGIYGFTQALLQLPFGLLSDHFGRKPLIYLGLAIFALGSLVAALADSLWLIILGRALQGMGAIASVIMALLADLTRDEKRTQAMATVGISIGLAFIAAMALGPWLAGWLGLSGIFWLTSVLSLLGMLVLWRWVPTPARARKHYDAGIDLSQLGPVASNPQLLRLDLSILLLHLVLTGIFIAVPGLLMEAGWQLVQHGWIYLTSMLLGFFAMIPLIIYGEKKRKMKTVLLLGFILLASGLFIMGWHSWGLLLGLFVFFTGFNLLEASLPSLVSKQAPVVAKGTAMGIYSTSQFLGAFLGGVLGGWLLGWLGAEGVLLGAAGLTLLWVLGLLGFRQPRHLSSRTFHLPALQGQELTGFQTQLEQLEGVEEVVFLIAEGTAYLKLDRTCLDEQALEDLLSSRV